MDDARGIAERIIRSDVVRDSEPAYAGGMWQLQLGTLVICVVLFYLADRYIVGCEKI